MTATAIKVELRNVKYAAFASQETSCFEATVYMDGRKSLTVRNGGTGGDNYWYDIIPGATKELKAYAATLPPVDYDGTKLDMDAGLLVGELLDAWLVERDVKRKLAKSVCFTKKGAVGVFTFSVKYSPDVAAQIRTKRSDIDKILQELPLTEAVNLFTSKA